MFWNIFFNSLALILGILALGWIVASLIGSRGHDDSNQVN